MQPCPWVADIARMKALWEEHPSGPELRVFLNEWGTFKANIADLARTSEEIKVALWGNGVEGRLRRIEIKLAWLLGALAVVAAIASAGLSLGLKWFAS